MAAAYRPIILLSVFAASALAHAQAPRTPGVTWGVLGGGRKLDDDVQRGTERYTALVLQRPIAPRHSLRFELARDAQSGSSSFGVTCDSCITSTRYGGTSWGAMVNWVYERRVGRQLRPYAYLGTGIFRGRSEFRPGSCPSGTCVLGAFQQPTDDAGWGQASAAGIGVTAEWRRVRAFAELRGSYIGGGGSSGANGVMFGLTIR
ncbi:MAG: hypothetical protein IPK85_07305 [Gemmatimonadetes bacterium]|nr:hypothetical protein [Gemmatimonadota bacterium]